MTAHVLSATTKQLGKQMGVYQHLTHQVKNELQSRHGKKKTSAERAKIKARRKQRSH